MDCGIISKNQMNLKIKKLLKEVVKEDFIMEKDGKKEYDRRTKKME